MDIVPFICNINIETKWIFVARYDDMNLTINHLGLLFFNISFLDSEQNDLACPLTTVELIGALRNGQGA